MDQWDTNDDGVITIDEIPAPHGKLAMNHLDCSGDRKIQKDEVEKFRKMFNNGNVLGRPDGIKTEQKDEQEPSSEKSAP